MFRFLTWFFFHTDQRELLRPQALHGRTVDFVRCDGCEHDLRLVVDGLCVGHALDHGAIRRLLPLLRGAVSDDAAYARFYQQATTATWMHGYEQPLVLPTAEDVRQHGGGTSFGRLLHGVLTFGGDPR